MTTGKILRSRDLPNSHFGEGVTKLGDRLYQVTWQTNRGWSYNVDNFNDAKEFKVRIGTDISIAIYQPRKHLKHSETSIIIASFYLNIILLNISFFDVLADTAL